MEHITGSRGDPERVDRFRELYDEAYPRIVAYARRRARNQEDALDVVSETFMVVWRRLDDIPEGREVPWVYGVARRVLANQYRSRTRRASLENVLKDNQTRETSEESFSDVVHQALARLRPQDREILTLEAWDDLDNSEIAEVLGVSEGNVAVRLHRARKRLARELARLGPNHSIETPDQVKSEDGYRTPDGVNGTLPGPGEVETP